MNKVLVPILLLCACPPLQAEARKPEAVSMTLAEVRARALHSNPTLHVEWVNPAARAAAVLRERGTFDHVLNSQFLKTQRRTPSGTFFDAATSSYNDTNAFTLGLNRVTKEGTRYGFDLDVSRIVTNSRQRLFNPSFPGEVLFSVAQPLLEGNGDDVQMVALRVAANDLAVSLEDLERVTEEIVVLAEVAYWELWFRLQDLEVRSFLLEQASGLVQDNRTRFEVGEVDRTELLEAQSAMSVRSEDVVRARGAVGEQIERLISLLGLFGPSGESHEIIPSDAPDLTAITPVDLREMAKVALAERSERQSAMIAIGSRRMEARRAYNQRLPRADLTAAYGFNGLSQDLDKTLDQSFGSEFQSWNAGVVFEAPLENRRAKGEHLRLVAEQERARRNVAAVENRLIEESRVAGWRLNTNLERVTAARTAVRNANENLAAQEERFRIGLLRSFELLRFQEELALTRSREARAVADAVIARSQLDQATGTVAEKRDISIEGPMTLEVPEIEATP